MWLRTFVIKCQRDLIAGIRTELNRTEIKIEKGRNRKYIEE